MTDEKTEETTGKPSKKASGPRNAGVILGTLEDGQLLIDLGVKFQRLGQELSRVADQAGKAKGTITLKINMSAESGGVVTIASDITVKEPQTPRQKSVRWLLSDGNLTNTNPKQTLLPLREVSGPEKRVQIDDETGEVRSV